MSIFLISLHSVFLKHRITHHIVAWAQYINFVVLLNFLLVTSRWKSHLLLFHHEFLLSILGSGTWFHFLSLGSRIVSSRNVHCLIILSGSFILIKRTLVIICLFHLSWTTINFFILTLLSLCTHDSIWSVLIRTI